MDIYADRFEGFFLLGYPAAAQIGQQPYARISLQGTYTHTSSARQSDKHFWVFFFPVKSRKRISAAEQVLLFSPVRLMAHFVCFSFQQKNALAINHLTRD